jgi:hypothetical protein
MNQFKLQERHQRKNLVSDVNFKIKNLDFGQGLFNQKLDFDTSDDLNYKILKVNDDFCCINNSFESDIQNTFFKTISEDMYFSLD